MQEKNKKKTIQKACVKFYFKEKEKKKLKRKMEKFSYLKDEKIFVHKENKKKRNVVICCARTKTMSDVGGSRSQCLTPELTCIYN